jgi:hypothetical protein
MAHQLQSYVDLCVAVGIDASRLDMMDVYLAAGSIQREGGSLAKVRAMTDAERAGLRDRALASLPPIIKRKS